MNMHVGSLHWGNRVKDAGRHLWRSSSPTPYSEQDHFKQVAQGCVWSGFEYFQR